VLGWVPLKVSQRRTFRDSWCEMQAGCSSCHTKQGRDLRTNLHITQLLHQDILLGEESASILVTSLNPVHTVSYPASTRTDRQTHKLTWSHNILGWCNACRKASLKKVCFLFHNDQHFDRFTIRARHKAKTSFCIWSISVCFFTIICRDPSSSLVISAFLRHTIISTVWPTMAAAFHSNVSTLTWVYWYQNNQTSKPKLSALDTFG